MIHQFTKYINIKRQILMNSSARAQSQQKNRLSLSLKPIPKLFDRYTGKQIKPVITSHRHKQLKIGTNTKQRKPEKVSFEYIKTLKPDQIYYLSKTNISRLKAYSIMNEFIIKVNNQEHILNRNIKSHKDKQIGAFRSRSISSRSISKTSAVSKNKASCDIIKDYKTEHENIAIIPSFTPHQQIQNKYILKDINENTDQMNKIFVTSEKIDSFQDFIKTIQQEISINRLVYDRFIPSSQLLNIISALENRFSDHNSSKQLINMMIDFMSYCKNTYGCLPKLKTTFTNNFPKELAERWQKIREPIYFLNKSQVRILSFIISSPESGKSYYGGYFQQFQMNLSQKNCLDLAAIVIQMCRQHTGSFAFLTNFLWGSCVNLSQKGVSLQTIGERYKLILNQLCQKYRPAPQIQGNDEELDTHLSTKQQSLIPEISIDLSGKTNRDQLINDFIMERAEEAKSHYDQFLKFMKYVCKKNDGFHFKSGLKIKQRSETRALLRIKQKMLKDIYSKQIENQVQQPKQDVKLNNQSYSLKEMIEDEKKKYEQKIRKIYDNLNEPLYFKVSDMLRGKCAFSAVEKINQCCTDIKQALNTQQYKHLKLIEIDNRLRMGTSDLVLKIRFGNVIAQMQLVINLSASKYAFAHKVYQLERSKFFTPLTQLSIMNDNISNSFFTEVEEYISANTKNDKQDYDQTVTFKQASKYYQEFLRSLPYEKETNQKFQDKADINLMNEEIQMFNFLKSVRQQDCLFKQLSGWQISLGVGQYYHLMKQYQKSFRQFGSALEQIRILIKNYSYNQQFRDSISFADIKKHQFNILSKLGKIQQETGNAMKSIQFYSQSLQLQEKMNGKQTLQFAKLLNNMGLSYSQLGLEQKALQAYSQALRIHQRLQAGGINSAATSNNMGLIYLKQGNLPKALDMFRYSLLIHQRVNGEDSLDATVPLINIGAVYKQQGLFENALQNYYRALQIVQKSKGKKNIDTSPILAHIGGIYLLQEDYSAAKQFVTESLEILQRVQGKDHIKKVELSMTMGQIYRRTSQNKHQALRLLNQSLQITKKTKGVGSIQTASIIRQIGLFQNMLGNNQAALKCYKQTLQIQEIHKGQYSFQSSETLYYLGVFYLVQNNLELAKDFFQKSLSIQQKYKGFAHSCTFKNLDCMAMIYNVQGDYSKSLQLFEQCRQIKQRQNGRKRGFSIDCLMKIACIHIKLNNYSKALQILSQSQQIQQRMPKKNNHIFLQTIDLIASLYYALEREVQAFEALNKCYWVSCQLYGYDHMNTANILHKKGEAKRKMGQLSMAHFFLNQSIQLTIELEGRESTQLEHRYKQLVTVCIQSRMYIQALKYCNLCLQIQQKNKGVQSIEVAATINNIGIIYQSIGDFQRALIAFQDSIKIHFKLKGQGCLQSASSINNLANLLRDIGQLQLALQLYYKYLLIIEKYQNNYITEIIVAMSNIGNLCLRLQKYADIFIFFSKYLPLAIKLTNRQNLGIASLLNIIGATHFNIKNYPQALQLFLEALSIQQLRLNKRHINTASSLMSVSHTYMQLGKYQQASKHLQEVLRVYLINIDWGRIEIKNAAILLSQCYQRLNQDEKSQRVLQLYGITPL